MPTRILLGPDFEDFTMTSENYRWLHACRWEASHSEVFAHARSQLTHSLGKFPNLIKNKNAVSPETRAHWLLVDEDETPLAWAELQTFPGKHDEFGILIWGQCQNKEKRNFDLAHLSRLISFAFVVGKFDHMKIACGQREDENFLFQLAAAAGEMRRTLVVESHAWHPKLMHPSFPINTFEVAKQEWLNCPLSDQKNRLLQQVSQRVQRHERAQLGMQKQKRRSFLARLLRPKADDSIL